MAIELKPCPFCGGKSKVSCRQYRFKGQCDDGTKRIKYAFYGICNRCKATGGTVTGEINCGLGQSRDDFRFYEELAAEAWNRRSDDDTDDTAEWIDKEVRGSMTNVCSVCGSCSVYPDKYCGGCGRSMQNGY